MSVTTYQIDRESTQRSRSGLAPQAPPFARGSWVAFYLLPPVFMALPLAWFGAGMAAELSRPSGLILWGLICVISWGLSDVLARGLALLLPPKLLPPWALLTLGYLINTALASLYNPAVIDVMLKIGLAPYSPMFEAFFAVDRNLLDPEYLMLLYGSCVPGLFCWLVGNYLFEKISGIPRFTHPAAAARTKLAVEPVNLRAISQTVEPTAAAKTPAFFNRLVRLHGLTTDELVAVVAEDHYIQVMSRRGKELVYFRFRDALSELTGLHGLQIHRSAWVHLPNVTGLHSQGRSLHVQLVTEDVLKVSQSNRGALLRAGIKPLN
jgi:hypothetical protein